MLNKQLLQLTLDTIKANPQHWDQVYWHCGTTHCFAGFVELLHKQQSLDTYFDEYDVDGGDVADYAMKALGLTIYQADSLFSPVNTLEDLEHRVNILMNTDVPLFSSTV